MNSSPARHSKTSNLMMNSSSPSQSKTQNLKHRYKPYLTKLFLRHFLLKCTSSEVTLSSLKPEFAPKLGMPQSLNSENNNCLFLKQVPSLPSINTALTLNYKTVAIP